MISLLHYKYRNNRNLITQLVFIIGMTAPLELKFFGVNFYLKFKTNFIIKNINKTRLQT